MIPSDRSPSEQTPLARSRLTGLDAARVLATFGIIWVHTAEGHSHGHSWTALGRFGTSFYIIVAALFVVRGSVKAKPRTMGNEIAHRAKRLLLPFVIWSLIYGLYYGTLGFMKGASFKDLTFWWGPVAGTAVHLWFLPFVFFWGVLAAFVAPRASRAPLPLLVGGGAVICVGLYWVCYRWLHFALNRYWLWDYHLHRLDRWIVEVPPFVTAVWGALVFQRLGQAGQEFFKKRLIPLAALGLVGFVLAEFIYADQVMTIKEMTHTEGRFMGNIAAVFLLGAFLAMDGKALIVRLAPLGGYTYVAFLVHMLVIELLRGPVKFWPGYGSLWFSLLESVCVFAGSLGFSWLVKNYRALAFLRA